MPHPGGEKAMARAIEVRLIGVSEQRVSRCVLSSGEETVAEAVAMAFPGFAADCFAADGTVVGAGYPASSASRRIDAWKVPGADPGTWLAVGAFVAKVIVAAAVSAAVSFGISAIMKKRLKTPKYSKQVDDLSDNQYGWDYDATNAVAEGSPVPVLYGERLVLPPVIQQHTITENSTGDSYLSCVFAVAERGAGFSDVITYGETDSGRLDARINHAEWENYLDESLDVSTDEDRLRGQTVYVSYNEDKDTGTETDALTDGLDSTVKGLGSAVYFSLPSAIMVRRIVVRTFNYYLRSSHPTIKRGVQGFSVYGKSSVGKWEYIGRVSSSYWDEGGKRNVARCTFTSNSDKMYSRFMLKDFSRVRLSGSNGDDGTCLSLSCYGDSTTENTIRGGLVEVEANSGLLTQGALSATSQGLWGSLPVSKRLDTTDFTFRTTPGAYPNRLAIHLQWPYGLYSVNQESATASGYDDMSVTIQAMYRPHGSGDDAWLSFGELSKTGTTITDNKASEKRLYYEQELGDSPAESYDVRVRFKTKPEQDPMMQSETIWEGLDEGWDFVPNYPGTATAGMRMKASENLSGGIPQFKILARRMTVIVYNTITSMWEERPASNPAWATYDMIVRPYFDSEHFDLMKEVLDENGDFVFDENGEIVFEFDRKGTLEDYNNGEVDRKWNSGDPLVSVNHSQTRVIYSDFLRWAEFCEANDITCSMYYDGTTTIGEAIEHLLTIGRASLVDRGGSIGVFVDGPADAVDDDGYPVGSFMFDDSNIVADSFSVTYSDRTEYPDAISVTFFDREREYQRYTLRNRYGDDDSGSVYATQTQDITLSACDRKEVAQAYADYMMKQLKIERTYSWKSGMVAMPLEIGDHVVVNGHHATITEVSVTDDHDYSFVAMEYVPERFS